MTAIEAHDSGPAVRGHAAQLRTICRTGRFADGDASLMMLRSRCPRGEDTDLVLADSDRWISTHDTSDDTVVYVRCTCGMPHVVVVGHTGATIGRIVEP